MNQGRRRWSLHRGIRLCAVVVWVALLTGCASQTRLVVNGLDASDPAYSQEACQQSKPLADLQDDIKLVRTLGSPLVLFMSGPAALLPVLATNVGLDALDHMDASQVSVNCGGFETPTYNMVERVMLGLGLNVLTPGLRIPGK